ncbi:MAG TPA: CPBP family glutamic-type intramembrane protease, partial [Anaerolineae bacterium]|nr:CPBP family glutamic-type intramembrane protease [Anaerolineae bacterium]
GAQPVPPVAWMAMQVPLVFLGLLAGWALLRRSGLLQAGIGRSLLLTSGTGAAAKGALQGMALALPWALLNVAMGGGAGDEWARAWWAPLVALQPGIAEEAWGRVLLVSLLYLPLSRLGRTRIALAWAAIVAGYWFAFLHTQGSNPLSALVSTLLIGTLYSLPLTYLWLRRGLEPAMGFHFAVDFLRFAAALLIRAGA